MKKLKLKGFSLIECIVALALIGITSMLIAQVYGAVALMNRNNSRLNTSLVEQMKIAEKEITTNGTYVNVKKKQCINGDGMQFKIKTADTYDDPTSPKYNNGKAKSEFKIMLDKPTASKGHEQQKAPYEIYVLDPKDKMTVDETNDVDSGRTRKMDQDVRYKFILPMP